MDQFDKAIQQMAAHIVPADTGLASVSLYFTADTRELVDAFVAAVEPDGWGLYNDPMDPEELNQQYPLDEPRVDWYFAINKITKFSLVELHKLEEVMVAKAKGMGLDYDGWEVGGA